MCCTVILCQFHLYLTTKGEADRMALMLVRIIIEPHVHYIITTRQQGWRIILTEMDIYESACAYQEKSLCQQATVFRSSQENAHLSPTHKTQFFLKCMQFNFDSFSLFLLLIMGAGIVIGCGEQKETRLRKRLWLVFDRNFQSLQLSLHLALMR